MSYRMRDAMLEVLAVCHECAGNETLQKRWGVPVWLEIDVLINHVLKSGKVSRGRLGEVINAMVVSGLLRREGNAVIPPEILAGGKVEASPPDPTHEAYLTIVRGIERFGGDARLISLTAQGARLRLVGKENILVLAELVDRALRTGGRG